MQMPLTSASLFLGPIELPGVCEKEIAQKWAKICHVCAQGIMPYSRNQLIEAPRRIEHTQFVPFHQGIVSSLHVFWIQISEVRVRFSIL